ncbi:capsid and scaffold protein [Streptococcus phage vB_SthS_VA460]|uniref:Capsid and scaffold protein n=1 Tax=Streptococcus phage vB_SthS_VA460 TaxID=2069609 RepID=A0A2I6QQZ6_9CAUD|nr:capsid and scaffold protein [Streptococcus phage vB_SthS_VA460]AUN43414.1 capsid and scaffold protein [Streptococcus phage vB_SthS_VA460]
MILKFFKAIWAIFDILMFVLAAISLNVTTYHIGYVWFGISMTITFILAGLISELISGKGKE